MQLDEITYGQVFRQLCRDDIPGIRRLFDSATADASEETNGYKEMSRAVDVRGMAALVPRITIDTVVKNIDKNLFNILGKNDASLTLKDVTKAMDAAVKTVVEQIKEKYSRAKKQSSGISRS